LATNHASASVCFKVVLPLGGKPLALGDSTVLESATKVMIASFAGARARALA